MSLTLIVVLILDSSSIKIRGQDRPNSPHGRNTNFGIPLGTELNRHSKAFIEIPIRKFPFEKETNSHITITARVLLVSNYHLVETLGNGTDLSLHYSYASSLVLADNVS